ncbi:MAG: hypothetical protein U5O12_11900, partial [Rhodoferax sp.]|nr:hypothetical protein [Rhodoferax sp.]
MSGLNATVDTSDANPPKTGDGVPSVGASIPATTSNSTALASLCTIARFHQIAADPATLAHQMGIASTDAVTTSDLLGAAQHLGL